MAKKSVERATDVPVTQKMLYGVRDQLQSEMAALRTDLKSDIHGLKSEIHEVKSEMHGLRSEIHEVKSEMHGLRSEVHEVKSEMHGLKSEIHEVKSEMHGLRSEIHEVQSDQQSMKSAIHGLKAEMHRVALLVEEQNAKNNIVLDGLTSLFHRQDRVEADVKDLRHTIHEIKSAK